MRCVVDENDPVESIAVISGRTELIDRHLQITLSLPFKVVQPVDVICVHGSASFLDRGFVRTGSPIDL